VTERVHLLRALARVVAVQGAAPVAERMCRAAVELLDAGGAALTCAPTEPTRYRACATDELASLLDQAEEVVGDGPGVRAFRERRSVGTLLGAGPAPGATSGAASDAASGGPSGPGSGPATERGCEAPVERLAVFELLAGDLAPVGLHVRAWPVRGASGPLAVLTVHGVPTQRGTELVADGQVLADALAPALRAVSAQAARCRADLDRAVGMVVAQTGSAPGDAHALIRGRAWSEGMTLAGVVQGVLERRVRFAGPGAGTSGGD
jgi:hypothetical protein